MTNWGEFPEEWVNASGIFAKLHRLMDTPRLPNGEWRMIANGRIYSLEVVNGEIVPASGPGSSSDPLTDISVDWDDSGTALRIKFHRHIRRAKGRDVIQDWTGYLMTSPLDFDKVPIDEKYRIAGTYEQIIESGPNVNGGWYATIDRADVPETDDVSATI